MDVLSPFLADLSARFRELFSQEQVWHVTQAVILVVAGVVLARVTRLVIVRSFSKTMTRQQLMLLRRGVSYGILILFVASALIELGFNLSLLFGAAGIVTVALGFASQTSVSNLISGLFLVLERAVEVGDLITVEGTTGEVLSVDLLSTKLRTFDNLYVRIPNETMVKTNIINLNRFPIRRVDVKVGVAYKENLGEVLDILRSVADKNPLALEEPAPLLIAQGFGDSSVNYQFSVWTQSKNYLDLLNALQQDIKEAFDKAGVEIPFPHISLYRGSQSAPLQVELLSAAFEKE